MLALVLRSASTDICAVLDCLGATAEPAAAGVVCAVAGAMVLRADLEMSISISFAHASSSIQPAGSHVCLGCASPALTNKHKQTSTQVRCGLRTGRPCVTSGGVMCLQLPSNEKLSTVAIIFHIQ